MCIAAASTANLVGTYVETKRMLRRAMSTNKPLCNMTRKILILSNLVSKRRGVATLHLNTASANGVEAAA